MVNATIGWLENQTGSLQNSLISFTHWGNASTISLDPVANPITPGSVSFWKMQRLMVTLNDSSKVSNLRLVFSGTQPSNTSLMSTATTAGYASIAWAAPAGSTTGYSWYAMTTNTGISANLGIAGSLTASILTTGSLSDHFASQIHTSASATEGPASNYTVKVVFDEVR